MTANIDSASPSTPTRSALGQSAGSALCAGCQWIADKPGQWCDMFRHAPEELPCTQHDQYAPIREAMVKTGMAKLVIAAEIEL